MIWVERSVRAGLRAVGLGSRYVETAVARHHVYDGRGSGSLPTLVFLPGLCDTAASFAPVFLRLKRRARRVVAVESAGHGLSGAPRLEYTVKRHVESVCGVLDATLNEPAILVANSLGGASALHYAHKRPDRVLGLFLTSPAGAPVDGATREDLRRSFAMRTATDARAFLDRVFYRPPILGPLLIPLMLARARSRVVAEIFRSSENEHLLPDELAALTMPMVVVWGRSERLLPRSGLEHFRRHLPAHAEIIEPDGFGHCPHLDAPGRLSGMIASFAERVVDSKAS